MFMLIRKQQPDLLYPFNRTHAPNMNMYNQAKGQHVLPTWHLYTAAHVHNSMSNNN